jgi:hypothetical protein
MLYFPTLSFLIGVPLSILIFLAVMWPPKTPYVTRKGSDTHEVIWLWRIPAYADHPAWYIRWTWSDGVTARAYCYDPEKSAAYRAAGNQ